MYSNCEVKFILKGGYAAFVKRKQDLFTINVFKQKEEKPEFTRDVVLKTAINTVETYKNVLIKVLQDTDYITEGMEDVCVKSLE